MVLYHNWRHAFNVCQLMFALLTVSVFGEGERSSVTCGVHFALEPPTHVMGVCVSTTMSGLHSCSTADVLKQA